MTNTIMPPIHPGETLSEEFLGPLGITPYRLAKNIGTTQSRVADILNGRRRITADTALRLGRYFNTSPEFWLNLQNHYDIETKRDERDMSDRLLEIEPVRHC